MRWSDVHMLRFLDGECLAVNDGVDDLLAAVLQQPLDRGKEW